MAAGKFDRRLSLEAPSTRVSASGGVDQIWTLLGGVWAELVQATGGEARDADQVVAEQKTVFRIRYRRDILPEMRVVYRGRPYAIEDVSEPDRNQHIVLTCSALNVQSGNS